MRLSRKIIYSIAAVAFTAIILQWTQVWSSGSGPQSPYTGAPGETNCTSCHGSSSATSAGTKLTLKNQQGGFDYIPDSVYTMTITWSGSGCSRRGFQVTALYGSSNLMAGSFTKIDNNTRKFSATVNSNSRDYIEHVNVSQTSWTFQWKAPSSNVGDVKFYVAFNCADGDGQASSGDVIYADVLTCKPSSKLPTANISSNTTAICIGDTVSFTGSGTNSPTAYTWTFPSGTPSSSTVQNPKVKWNTAGNFNASLVVTNAYGKSVSVIKQIQVKARPDTTISIQGSTTICEGDSLKLTAPGGLTYTWNTGQTSQIIYAKQSGNYFATLSNGTCSRKSQTITVKVNPRPKPTVSNNLSGHGITDTATVCEGDSLVMTVTPDASFATYSFYEKTTLRQSGTSNIYSVRGTFTTHQYHVIVTDVNGCSSEKSDVVSVLFKKRTIAPTLTAGTSTTGSVTVSWATVTGATGYEVSADSGKTWKIPSTGATGKSHTETGLKSDQSIKMMVRATDATACKNGLAKEIVLKTLPCSELTYDLAYDSIICPGGKTVITFSNFSSPTYAIRFVGNSPTKNLTFTVSPSVTSSYGFEIVDSAKLNCPPIKFEVKVNVDILPALSLTPDKLSYCEGDEVTITADAGYTSYAFTVNGTQVQDDASNILKTTSLKPGDKVSVTGTTLAGCENIASELTPTIFTNPKAGFNLSKNFLQITFSDTTADASSRTWYFGDGTTSTDANPVHTYTSQGNYTVSLKVINDNGCTDSISQTIYAQSSGIGEPQKDISSINIYPNPVGENLTITLYIQRTSRIQVKLYDGRGMSVYLSEPTNYAAGRQDIIIPAGHLKGGVYFVQVVSGTDGSVSTQKILKKQEK